MKCSYRDALCSLTFIVIISSLLIVIIQLGNEKTTSLTIAMDSIGNLLSGLGTIGILFLAIYEIPTESVKWRKRKEEDAKLERKRLDYQAKLERDNKQWEKRASKAGSLLLGLERVIKGVEYVSSQFFVGEYEVSEVEVSDEQKNEKIIEAINNRFNAIEKNFNNYYKIYSESRYYFKENIIQELDEVIEEFKKLRVSFEMYAMMLSYSSDYKDQKNMAHSDFFDVKNVRKEKLKKIYNSVSSDLKKYFSNESFA